jgi:hypothetical protein
MTLSPTSFPPIHSAFAYAPFTPFPSPLPIHLFRPFLHFHMLVVFPRTFPFPFCPFPICFLPNPLCFFLLVHRQKLIKGLSVHDSIFTDVIFMEYCFFKLCCYQFHIKHNYPSVVTNKANITQSSRQSCTYQRNQ